MLSLKEKIIKLEEEKEQLQELVASPSPSEKQFLPSLPHVLFLVQIRITPQEV